MPFKDWFGIFGLLLSPPKDYRRVARGRGAAATTIPGPDFDVIAP
jgi:hypothetical protein